MELWTEKEGSVIPAARAITAMAKVAADGKSPAPKAWGYLSPDKRLMWCCMAKVDEYHILSDWDSLSEVAKTKLQVSTMAMLDLFRNIGVGMDVRRS